MNFIKTALPLFPLFITACGANIIPMAGAWEANLTVTDNTCDLDMDTSPPLPFSLGDVTEDSLTIDIGSDDLFSCALNRGTFECSPITGSIDLTEDGIDAVLTISQTIDGALDDEHSGELTWTIDYSCEGEQCDEAASYAGITLPCSTVSSGPISRDM